MKTIFTRLRNSVKFPLGQKSNSIILGFKKANSIPTLPNWLEKLNKNIFIRIFRFIGGFCVLLVFTGYSLEFPDLLQYIVILLSIFQILQMWLIFITKAIYMTYTLIYKKTDFEVRNSPSLRPHR